MKLQGKVALITGGGTGIGRACAVLFAQEGAKVALVGRRIEPLQKVEKQIEQSGGTARSVPADVTREEEVKRMVDTVLSEWGRIDVLVNGAGTSERGNVVETSVGEFERVMQVNVRGTFLTCKYVMPHMLAQKSGSVINIASIFGMIGVPRRVSYAASKGAVINMTRAMAMDHAADGVRVNCLAPGWVATELSLYMISLEPDPAAALKARQTMHPIPRGGKPEEVAAAALYLASDEAQWVTGVCLPVDGGYTAR
jgi:NAD(P)-dependent dehydrogenase (short-subunit alcohol dehydrogenase family)